MKLIDLLLARDPGTGRPVLNLPPTFGMYAFDCGVNAGQVLDVPRHADFLAGYPLRSPGC